MGVSTSLIAAGIAWVLTDPTHFLRGLIVTGMGVVVFIATYFLTKKKSTATPSIHREVIQENVKQEISPRIDVSPKFIFGNSVSPAAAPAVASSTPELRCNIEFLDVEVATQTDYAGHSFQTACATFENKYIEGQKLRTPTLRGRLIFKHPDGHLVLDLQNVAWWPDDNRFATFSANSPKQLLLFFSPSDAAEPNLWARSVRQQTTRVQGALRHIPEPESHPISEHIGSVEVQLLTETECLCRKVLKFEDDGNFPKFVGVEA